MLILIFISKIKLNIYFKNIKLTLPIIMLTLISSLLFQSSNESFCNFCGLLIPVSTLANCTIIFFRISLSILISSLTSFTTTPMDLTKALDWLFDPLKFLKIPVNDLSLLITLTLRLIPTVIEQTNKIIDAQKIRGANFNNKNIFKKLNSIIYVIVPTLISLLKKTTDFATALECRCYTGKARTRFKPLKLKKEDITALLVLIVLAIAFMFVECVSNKVFILS